MPNPVYIILNPVAGGNKGRKLIAPLRILAEKYWPGNYDLIFTRRSGDAIDLAAGLASKGGCTVIAAGGDGTINEVVNGLLSFQNDALVPCTLGVINCGSGAGLAQTLGLPSSLEAQMEGISTWAAAPLDVGAVLCADSSGAMRERLYINECQIGFGGEVVSRVGMAHKRFGGKAAFGSVAVGQLFAYRSTQMTLVLDGKDTIAGNLIGVVAGNGSRCAGGMRLTPDALPYDGLLDVLCISEMSLLNRVRCFSQVYSGNHIKQPFFGLHRVKEVQIESDLPVWVEADGELLGRTPCEIRLKASAIQVLFPNAKAKLHELHNSDPKLAALRV